MSAVWLYGIHLLESILQNQPQRMLELWCLPKAKDAQIVKDAEAFGIPVHVVRLVKILKYCPEAESTGILARCTAYRPLDFTAWLEAVASQPSSCWLMLHSLFDPHNLGACWRSAAALGATGLLLGQQDCCGVTSAVERVAAGGCQVLPAYRFSFDQAFWQKTTELGVQRIALSSMMPSCPTITQTSLKKTVILAAGNEHEGLPDAWQSYWHSHFPISMHGDMESLNVSVAVGIALHHIVQAI